MPRLTTVVLLVWITAAGLTCLAGGCKETDEAVPTGGDPQAAVADLIHSATDAAGAEPTRGTIYYTPANLYDYIDGQAEEFLAAGFVLLSHSEVRAKGAAGKAYVEIDIYDMASPEGVKKVMVAPPPDKAAEIAPGVQAYRDTGLCEFGVGRYYVRLTARFDTAGQKALVDALARGMAKAAAAK